MRTSLVNVRPFGVSKALLHDKAHIENNGLPSTRGIHTSHKTFHRNFDTSTLAAMGHTSGHKCTVNTLRRLLSLLHMDMSIPPLSYYSAGSPCSTLLIRATVLGKADAMRKLPLDTHTSEE